MQDGQDQQHDLCSTGEGGDELVQCCQQAQLLPPHQVGTQPVQQGLKPQREHLVLLFVGGGGRVCQQQRRQTLGWERRVGKGLGVGGAKDKAEKER